MTVDNLIFQTMFPCCIVCHHSPQSSTVKYSLDHFVGCCGIICLYKYSPFSEKNYSHLKWSVMFERNVKFSELLIHFLAL